MKKIVIVAVSAVAFAGCVTTYNEPVESRAPRTVSGADLAVTDLGDHVITRPLAGTTLLFGASAPLAEASPEGPADKDNVKFTPLARTDSRAWGETDVSVQPWTYDAETEPSGPLVLAAALERGANAGANLAFRATRIVVVGDAAFALNGALASRANANRDFLLNAFAWLAGLDASARGALAAALTASSSFASVVVAGHELADMGRFAKRFFVMKGGVIYEAADVAAAGKALA